MARKLGIYSTEDMQVMNALYTGIKAKLSSKFSEADIRLGRPGGLFGLTAVLLFIVVRKFRPEVVVETGVAQGMSSFVILKALQSERTRQAHQRGPTEQKPRRL